LTSVDLPAPERPTRPIFSPGADVQVEVVDHRARRRRSEAHVLEAHLAARHLQRLRPGASTTARGRDSVLMPSCTVPTLLEQRRHLPHHPVRDAVQAQRHGGGGRHRADAHLALRPQPQRGAGGAPRSAACSAHVVDDLEAAHQAHLRVHRG
jgi:hypothetical protein